MKIYNEIVIDMNPESLTFKETLYEDSFEYEGDMMMADTKFGTKNWFLDTDGDGKYDTIVSADKSGVKTTSGGAVTLHQELHSEDPSAVDTQVEAVARGLGETHGWGIGSSDWGASLGGATTEDPGPFDYRDPTSEQFKESVTSTGGFGELAEEFGLEEGDFEEFYGKPLEYWEEEYGKGGTLEKGRGLRMDEYGLQKEELGLTGEALSESLRAATTSYDVGRKRTGMLAGQSLFDIKQQADVAAAKGGFATQGDIAATARRAGKGVFQDYTMQQKELASQMTGAQTAYDIGTRGADISGKRIGLGEEGVALDKTQANIDWKRNISDFWKKTEDEFYDQVSFVEGMK